MSRREDGSARGSLYGQRTNWRMDRISLGKCRPSGKTRVMHTAIYLDTNRRCILALDGVLVKLEQRQRAHGARFACEIELSQDDRDLINNLEHLGTRTLFQRQSLLKGNLLCVKLETLDVYTQGKYRKGMLHLGPMRFYIEFTNYWYATHKQQYGLSYRVKAIARR